MLKLILLLQGCFFMLLILDIPTGVNGHHFCLVFLTISYISHLFQPLTSCRVGGPQPHSHLEMLIYGTAPVVQETKKPSPLRSLFKHATKNHTNQTDIESIPYGTQDEVWGPALSLHGQIGCVCLLHDLLNLGQVEALYRTGTIW